MGRKVFLIWLIMINSPFYNTNKLSEQNERRDKTDTDKRKGPRSIKLLIRIMKINERSLVARFPDTASRGGSRRVSKWSRSPKRQRYT